MVENEKRETPRIPFYARINLLVEGAIIGPCMAKDLSLGGIFIETKNPPTKKIACIVQINFGDKNKHPLSIAGHIVRTAPNGIGIQFTEMDSNAFNVLTEIITTANPE